VLFVEGALPSASNAQKAALIPITAPKLRLTFSHEVINFIGGYLWFVAGGLKMNDRDALVRLPFRAGTTDSFESADESTLLRPHSCSIPVVSVKLFQPDKRCNSYRAAFALHSISEWKYFRW
jgi:hypothetical protein